MGRIICLFLTIKPYVCAVSGEDGVLGLSLRNVCRVLENYYDNSVEVHYSSKDLCECELLDSLIGESVCMYVINNREKEYIGLSNNIFKLNSSVDYKSYVIYIKKCNVEKEYIPINTLKKRCNYNNKQNLYEI